MTLADSLAVLLFAAVVAYGLFAGADFGAGLWDLTAGSAERGAPTRALIARSIGPVWEANHVWLIFALVILWTAFPPAFAAIGATLFIPLSLVAIGVILRGSAFAFRKVVADLPTRRTFGVIFASASVLTPFFLGAAVGGIASGRVPADGSGHAVTSWWNPTGVLGGVLAVLVCGFLAAVYLATDASRDRDEPLIRAFRRRALVAAIATGAVALAGIPVLRADAPSLYDGLTGRIGSLVIVLSAAAGILTIGLVAAHRFVEARVSGALAVVAVLVGWGVAQYPDLLVDQLTIAQGAGARSTLVATWIAVGVGLVVLVPSLTYLLVLVHRGDLGGDLGD